MTSGQAAKAEVERHVCRPPRREPGHKVGLLWICPDCWSELVWRPVASGELGRIINLWVRFYEPGNRAWVPPERRYRNHGRRR